MQIWQLMQAIRPIPLRAEVVIFDNRLWIKRSDVCYTPLSQQPEVIHNATIWQIDKSMEKELMEAGLEVRLYTCLEP